MIYTVDMNGGKQSVPVPVEFVVPETVVVISGPEGVFDKRVTPSRVGPVVYQSSFAPTVGLTVLDAPVPAANGPKMAVAGDVASVKLPVL
jgi:hypothetical protein